jgi:tetratricopeptide (TPR) repeat protein
MLDRTSALEEVLRQGSDRAVDIAGLLRNLDERRVKTEAEAKAICALLKSLPAKDPKAELAITSRLHAITGLFQEAETKEAALVLTEEGIPELCRIFDQLADTKDKQTMDDLLFVLKILAMYRTEAGTDRVISAARMPLMAEACMWSVILRQYNRDHPQAKRILRELGNPLPHGFLAVAFLDCANNRAIKGAEMTHPFNSAEGIKQLQAWLAGRDEKHYSYAHSAAASIPFIRAPERDQLLALALDHPQADVQLEGAWASAKLGSEGGLKVLARYCLDPNYSKQARQYLSELGRKDAIPREALSPDFQAKAEFANWLAYPTELGRAPDEVEIVDQRKLPWPPDGERKSLWLIKYQVKDTTGLADDDVGCGLVGSVTFCLFSYKLAERPPEDGYAIHCFWEMQSKRLIREIDVEQGGKNQETMLQQWHGGPLKGPEMVCMAELSPELKYPQKVVALATATLKGEEGWVVLDGPRSAWYPKRDMPDESQRAVLMLHVGRTLLGFQGQPDRQKFLVKQRPQRDPRQIITAYEKLLAEARSGSAGKKKQLLGMGSPLKKHFDAYVEAQFSSNGAAKDETVVRVYESLLAAARSRDETVHKEALDGFGPLGKHFERYVDALVATGRSKQVETVIEQFAPGWDHNLGYGKLGRAAFRCGSYDLAGRYFEKLRQSSKDWQRAEEMGLLAEIWVKRGQTEKAHALLVECLKRLLEESKTATGSDRKRFEDWFQHHRSTYLRLFPESGDAGLQKDGVPSTTLRNPA